MDITNHLATKNILMESLVEPSSPAQAFGLDSVDLVLDPNVAVYPNHATNLDRSGYCPYQIGCLDMFLFSEDSHIAFEGYIGY